MTESGAERRQTRGVRRTELFTDAVLGLLVIVLGLDLRAPQARPGHLVHGLLGQWPIYLAYGISFVNLAVVWIGHRTSFARLKTIDMPLTWANLGLLFVAALVPFGTSVVSGALREGNEGDLRAATALYALIGTLLMISWLVFDHRIERQPGLTEEGDGSVFRRKRRKSTVGVALFAVGGLLGYVSPWIALAIFLAVPIFLGLTSPPE